MSKILTPFLLLITVVNFAFAEVQISAPESAPAGAEIQVKYSGESDAKDFITIVSPDTPERKYNKFKYAKSRESIVELAVPEVPGPYEIRYLSKDGYETLAVQKIEITPVTATLSAPTELPAGASIEIEWTGPDNNRDFITIVEASAKEGKYNKYKYTKQKMGPRKLNKVELTVPDQAGDYEIRYVTADKRFTLASAPLKVTQTEASLSTVDQVAAGAEITIDWTGPDNEQDFITIVKAGEREGKYGRYKRVKNKYGPSKQNKVQLKVPDEAGSYEIRYLTGQKYLTLASVPVEVTATNASVNTLEEVVEGSKFEVDWTGPDNERDFITIVKASEPEGKYGPHKYVKYKFGPRKINKVELEAPEESGDYEVRYLTGQKYLTLASVPIKVVPASAEVAAPEEAVAKGVIEVTWEGPGNDHDYIAIVKPDDESGKSKKFAYVRRGKTLKIDVPSVEGDYEVQYVTGKQRVLAKQSMRVVPSKVPGKLSVVADAETLKSKSFDDDLSVALVLDASGSMLKRDLGERRIEVAKKAVNKLIEGPLNEGDQFSMRVFGHKEADSCRTDLEIPLGPLDQKAALGLVKSIEAKNLAKTPIAKSLELVKEDLGSAEGRKVVILVTDGEETCDGNPEEAIKKLAESGFNTRVNIVGLAIEEFMLKETFRDWARLGNGKYFDAKNADELEQSIVEAIEVPYEVLDAEDKLVASGVVNGEPLLVLPGDYRVRILSSPEKNFEKIAVLPEEHNMLTLEELG